MCTGSGCLLINGGRIRRPSLGHYCEHALGCDVPAVFPREFAGSVLRPVRWGDIWRACFGYRSQGPLGAAGACFGRWCASFTGSRLRGFGAPCGDRMQVCRGSRASGPKSGARVLRRNGASLVELGRVWALVDIGPNFVDISPTLVALGPHNWAGSCRVQATFGRIRVKLGQRQANVG